MPSSYPPWSIDKLHTHLKAMIDLEFWTIPYYFTAMYSIEDQHHPAFKTIMNVVNEEMLHVELACNIANAFGVDLKNHFTAPLYGKGIPHLSFALDTPSPIGTFKPYSSELGPLDEKRINTMCLIEYPQWRTGEGVNLRDSITKYGSIAAFYEATRYGASLHADKIRGNRNQVDIFANFFGNFKQQTISENTTKGMKQIYHLMEAIVYQGEGKTEGQANIPPVFQNTIDDPEPEIDHYRKFLSIRDLPKLPEIYHGVTHPSHSAGREAQVALIEGFNKLLSGLNKLFSGQENPHFGREMSSIGSYILNCWKNGAIPKFSKG